MRTIRSIMVLNGLLASATASFGDTLGPSFDCQKAKAPLAQVICADPELSVLDLRFSQAYWALLKQVGEAGAKQLKQEDVQFIQGVEGQCGIPAAGSPSQNPQARPCIKAAYEKQRQIWLSRLSGPGLEEANRSIERHIALQRRLQELGLIPGTANIDGVYGAGTRSAIAEWQRSETRAPTGLLGEEDAKALQGIVISSKSIRNINSTKVLVADNSPLPQDFGLTAKVECSPPKPIMSEINIMLPDRDVAYRFAKAFVGKSFDPIFSYANNELRKCTKHDENSQIMIRINGVNMVPIIIIHEGFPYPQGKWNVEQNLLSQFIHDEDERKAQEAALARQREAAALIATQRKAAHDKFNQDFKIEKWVAAGEIVANPFVFKGQVIGVRANFTKMVSESEAIFDNLRVSKVPTTEFKGGENLILAVKVRGAREEKGNTIPDLEYVGHYNCKLPGCADIAQ